MWGALPSDTQRVAELRLGTTDASNSPVDKPGLAAGSEWPQALSPQQSCCAWPLPCPQGPWLGWAWSFGQHSYPVSLAHMAVWSSGQSRGSGVGQTGFLPRLHHSQAVNPWPSYAPSLCLASLTGKRE